jgi:hypothetical protein
MLFLQNQYPNIDFFDIFCFSRNIDFLVDFSIALEIFRYRSVRVVALSVRKAQLRRLHRHLLKTQILRATTPTPSAPL